MWDVLELNVSVAVTVLVTPVGNVDWLVVGVRIVVALTLRVVDRLICAVRDKDGVAVIVFELVLLAVTVLLVFTVSDCLIVDDSVVVAVIVFDDVDVVV